MTDERRREVETSLVRVWPATIFTFGLAIVGDPPLWLVGLLVGVGSLGGLMLVAGHLLLSVDARARREDS